MRPGTPVRLLAPLRWSVDPATGFDIMAPLPAGTGGYVVKGDAPFGHVLVNFGRCQAHGVEVVACDDLEVEKWEPALGGVAI